MRGDGSLSGGSAAFAPCSRRVVSPGPAQNGPRPGTGALRERLLGGSDDIWATCRSELSNDEYIDMIGGRHV